MRAGTWIGLMAVALLSSGCASVGTSSPTAKRMRPAASVAPDGSASGFADVPDAERADSAMSGRMVIRNAGLSLAVDDIDAAGDAVVALAASSGGFVLSSSRTSYTIKVPSTGFEPVLEELTALGEVTRKSLSGEDVTSEYLDLEVRLKNAHAARDAYEALLKRATSVEEILKVEQALNATQERIELLEGRRKYLDENLALSTIRVSLRERKRPGPLKMLFDGTRWLVMKLIWL